MLHFTEKCKTINWFLSSLSHLTSFCSWKLNYISLLFSSNCFQSSKSHVHLSLLTLFRIIHPMAHVIFCKILRCGLLAHCPNFELEDHPLSVAHDCVFNLFTAIHPLSICNPVTCHSIMTTLILNAKWAETLSKNAVLGHCVGLFSGACASYRSIRTSAYYFWSYWG
jgi:hypothetical protein